MRSTRFLITAGALLLPALALAQVPVGFNTVNPACDNLMLDPGELYATKVTPGAPDERDDLLFDLRAKGGLQSDPGTEITGGSPVAIAPNWRVGQLDVHVHYAVVTYPPATPGGPGRFSVDSATISEADGGLVRVQEVGNSLPSGTLSSIGLSIPGSSARYPVTLRPTVSFDFPRGTTTNGVNIAFAPAIDVNDNDPSGNACPWGAKHADPLDTTNATPTRGAIIGYNVYRLQRGPAPVPTPADFKAALSDADQTNGWVGFIDLRTVRNLVADGTPPAAGTPSPLEVSAGADLGGLQNPNGIAFDGDEVAIFQDSANTPSGTARPGGAALAPNTSLPYWYAVQPVMTGRVSDFASTGFSSNLFFDGNHQCDVDGDTLMDGVDLDRIGCDPLTMDFISPQAEVGLDGLGLTYNSLPLLSAPMFFNGVAAELPAHGQVALSGRATGADVSIELTTGLERGSVLGYNVYRQLGETRVRVNQEPILAQGAESNVYRLVDVQASIARGSRATAMDYTVEVVYSDGTASTFVGPFSVSLEQQGAGQPARRRR